jgi:hypothetical protein
VLHPQQDAGLTSLLMEYLASFLGVERNTSAT